MLNRQSRAWTASQSQKWQGSIGLSPKINNHYTDIIHKHYNAGLLSANRLYVFAMPSSALTQNITVAAVLKWSEGMKVIMLL